MQIVYRAADILEAHIIAGMLQAEGIATHVGGYYLQGAIGDLSPNGFANVFVDDADVERAISLVQAYDQVKLYENEGDNSGEDADTAFDA